MEESTSSNLPDAELIGIQFGLASHHEIRTSSISDCPISHASQLANPFLGLPLEMGKCESCGTAEPGKCEGHFGYIELPIPVYHPSHVSELKRMLSLVCLKCLKMKSNKFPVKNNGVMEKLLSACCDEACHVSIKESKNNDGSFFLELRIPSRSRSHDGCWNFLDRFGYRYGDGCARPLLPSEVLVMLKKLPEDTRRKLAKKGYIPQDGYILRYIPVPPNCLSVPDISDGVSVMSSDLCSAMLKKVLRQIEVIRSSRSGEPNFEAHEVEANDLQVAVSQYLQVRGTGKAARDGDNRYGVSKEGSNSSSKAWVEKMRTLFISKGSGFSSRSVITGDAFRPVNEVGVPSEIAQKMTFEERVNVHNIQYLQSLVDKNLCLTFTDGLSTYSLREGSKGHTFLRLGQIVHRRIMDGDIVFINRPPTTHKHSLQALRVYVHEDHVVKINPLMCGPLAADFDGDCVHLFYPQSLSARAEVLELFSVEKQLLSSHSGNLNLQLATDSLLSLKTLFKRYFLDRASVQQLAMHASTRLPSPALLKAFSSGPCWTAEQVLQTALPSNLECHGDRMLIRGSEVLKLDFNRDVMASVINDILNAVFFNKSPEDALKFFDSLQPLLMENLFAEGFSVGLQDFFYPISDLKSMQMNIQDLSSLLYQLRSSFNELVKLQFENDIRQLKMPVANFILKSSALGNLIDSKSDSAIDKVVQQIGFLGLQLSDKRKFYSRNLVEEVASLFRQKYPFANMYPSEEFGLVKSCFFHGLDPYEEIVHSIATREVIVRSSKGLAEPGTLFKNLMAILRDVVICYDGTVRNISSNSIIQFEYGVGGMPSQTLFPAGEPVGVLAATAMSNPAYKAVLDSSPNSNSSWDMMKEILFCRTTFKNDLNDRRVILYLNDCFCGRKYCQENASCLVKNHLRKVSLRDAAVELSIEYKRPKLEPESCEIDTGLVGHIHLNAVLLKESGIGMNDILQKCDEQVNLLRKKKKFGYYFKRILLSVCECCFFKHSGSRWADMPCLKFFWQEQDLSDSQLERTKHIMADMICPILLDTIIKGDPRICTVNIIWINPGTTTWVQSPCSSRNGELAIEVTLEKTAVRQSGDAWRIVLDCCLPVFHLIDSTRSIPYAIKQIQDLFGISCTFDQAVQRLSTSVTMVTKSVLKEHLLLLASSMTCAGNLVGFNTSGIKALCRALNVQVPFTEATLYTPRKCFERASEKCHVDTLASIVGSCSWGKRVAIGTGAKFDVLWDTKEIQTTGKPADVYDFLHLVTSTNEEDIHSGCLGAEIENFDDVYKEPALSPELESKAVFEDAVEVDADPEIPGAGVSSWDAPSAGKEWKSATTGEEPGGWSSWGPKNDLPQPKQSSGANGWGASNAATAEDLSKAGGMDVSKSWGASNMGNPSPAWGQPVKDLASGSEEGGGWSSWGAKKDLPQLIESPGTKGWGASRSATADDSSKARGMDASNSWGASNMAVPSPGWGQPAKDLASGSEGGGCSSWGAKKDLPQLKESSGANGWGASRSATTDDSSKVRGMDASKSWGASNMGNPSSAWGQPAKDRASGSEEGGSSWGAKKDLPQLKESSGTNGWGGSRSATTDDSSKARGVDASKSWGASNMGNPSPAWGQPAKDLASGSEEGGGWSSWGAKKDLPQLKESPGTNGWGASRSATTDDSSKARGASKSWGASNMGNPSPAWGQPAKDLASGSEGGGWSSWGAKKDLSQLKESSGPNGWGASRSATTNDSSKAKGMDASKSWGASNMGDASPAWDQRAKKVASGLEEGGGWSSWGPNKDLSQPNKSSGANGWGASKSATTEDSLKSGGMDDSKPWVASDGGDPSPACLASGSEEGGGWSSWGAKRDLPQPKESSGANGWGASKSSWEQGDATWKKNKEAQNIGGSTGGWSKASGEEKKENRMASSGWGTSKLDNKPSPSWGQPKNSCGGGNGFGESHKKDDQMESSWGQAHDGSTSVDGWSAGKSSVNGVSSSWDSPKQDKPTHESQSPWGQPVGSGWNKKRTEGGRGWGSSNSGEWKSRKNRPPKQPGGPNDDSPSVALTATRKRMDIFSAEEQNVLSEVESIMQSIRRIMHQSGCNDGEPLPAEDQTFVVDNVLSYHPDKAAKIGTGVEFITVKKHSSFQESRCFYVVSTDGQNTDFSYIKCLESFVKGKYPMVAEAFTSKYFRKPRPVGNPSPPSPSPPSPPPQS